MVVEVATRGLRLEMMLNLRLGFVHEQVGLGEIPHGRDFLTMFALVD